MTVAVSFPPFLALIPWRSGGFLPGLSSSFIFCGRPTLCDPGAEDDLRLDSFPFLAFPSLSWPVTSSAAGIAAIYDFARALVGHVTEDWPT